MACSGRSWFKEFEELEQRGRLLLLFHADHYRGHHGWDGVHGGKVITLDRGSHLAEALAVIWNTRRAPMTLLIERFQFATAAGSSST